MVYQPKSAVGYRTLLTWKQAGEIYRRAKDFSRERLGRISDGRLIGHVNDSARSVQRNIEEGYKRATTKEYVQFLGFSRASLEELKGDFEEFKREWREGLRWAEKGEIRGGGETRVMVMKEIEELLDLIYGEDCMLGRQIESLEKKMVAEKTLPRSEMIKRGWGKSGSGEKRFWGEVEKRFGLIRGDRGIARRVEKGEGKVEKTEERVGWAEGRVGGSE